MTTHKKIIVLGDSMIDRYYQSKIDRISPEAPIPIHFIESVHDSLGGASNVVLNLTNLFQYEEDVSIEFFTLSGKDEESKNLSELLNHHQIHYYLYQEEERKTIIKNRIYVNDIMTTRFDIESTETILPENSKQMIQYIYENRHQILYIVFSDYQKGMLSFSFVTSIMKICKEMNILTFVDPKVKEIEKYQGAFLLKPNFKEASEISPSSENIDQMLFEIYHNMKCQYLLLTCGKDGMILYNSSQKHFFQHTFLPNITVKDVTGAGDSVFASLIYSFYKYKNIIKASEISNYIGYLSVQKIGNYLCSIRDIESFLDNEKKKNMTLDSKIFHFMDKNPTITLQECIKEIKEKYPKIVFTNGCFDIIHPGHLKLLKYSKSQGDFLIVGLNSDSSVKELKGPNRPFHSEDYRSLYLSLIHEVDMIIIFHQQTPYELLEFIKPHILVKGGDYTKESIIGKEWVEEVHIIPLVKDLQQQIYSTTSILQKTK